jgi:DNA-binding NtrC family response regulator
MKNIRNPLIFVVEDNPVYNSLISGVLRARKYKQVHSFNNPEECLTKISLNPDIIVLNYAYSGFTGLDLMRKVHETNPGIEFIFLSGQNDVETAVRIIKLGAADYIVKGERAPEKLISSIEYLLTVEKRDNVKKGIRKGTIYVFLILLVVVLLIIALALSTNIFGF